MENDFDIETKTLSELFDIGWKIQQELVNTSDESSESFCRNRKKAIDIFEKCEYMLDELALFSENESLEEVSTSEMRYFLLYALQGWLYSKTNATKPDVRIVNLEKANIYFHKYLKLTRNYEFHNYKFDKTESTSNQQAAASSEFVSGSSSRQQQFDENLINQACARNEKIKRFKEQKELEAKVKVLAAMTHIDEEHKRKLHIDYVKYWVNKSIDDLSLCISELNILSQSHNNNEHAHQDASKKASNIMSLDQKKPFIITKSQLQAQVFGAGYPSLPVYSIEQFYDQLAERGLMPDADAHHHQEPKGPVQIGGGVTDTPKDEEKAQKDLLEDRHDDEQLRKEREWDEFKDDHKRGSGNRFNRS